MRNTSLILYKSSLQRSSTSSVLSILYTNKLRSVRFCSLLNRKSIPSRNLIELSFKNKNKTHVHKGTTIFIFFFNGKIFYFLFRFLLFFWILFYFISFSMKIFDELLEINYELNDKSRINLTSWVIEHYLHCLFSKVGCFNKYSILNK